MDSKEKITTLHPQGKNGVNISFEKYTVIKSFIIETLKEVKVISYQDLNDKAIKDLSPTFEGKVAWYLVTVKLDLEARGIIERIPKISPHQIKLK